MKKADIIIIAAALVIAGGIALSLFLSETGRPAGLSAEIRIGGELYDTIPLPESGEREITVTAGGGKNTLRLSPDGVKVIWADCPSQDCVHAPKLKNTNSAIACLPHSLLIKLTGEVSGQTDDGTVDIIVG